MKTSRRANLILLLAAWATPASVRCGAGEPEAPPLTDAQRQQLLELPKQYRFSKTFAERQRAHYDQTSTPSASSLGVMA